MVTARPPAATSPDIDQRIPGRPVMKTTVAIPATRSRDPRRSARRKICVEYEEGLTGEVSQRMSAGYNNGPLKGTVGHMPVRIVMREPIVRVVDVRGLSSRSVGPAVDGWTCPCPPAAHCLVGARRGEFATLRVLWVPRRDRARGIRGNDVGREPTAQRRATVRRMWAAISF